MHKLIATFFGAGYAPIAPGTVGAIFACVISVLLSYFISDLTQYTILHIVLVLLGYVLGVWACNALAPEWGDDPSRVVMDEAIGFWITILFVSPTVVNLIIGLVLFRIFDIAKPLGIRTIDQKVKGGHGVMLDDVVAGIYGNICLQAIIYFGITQKLGLS